MKPSLLASTSQGKPQGLRKAFTSFGQHLTTLFQMGAGPAQHQNTQSTRGQQSSLLGIGLRPPQISPAYTPVLPQHQPSAPREGSIPAFSLHRWESDITSVCLPAVFYMAPFLPLCSLQPYSRSTDSFAPKRLRDDVKRKIHSHQASCCRHGSHRLPPLF